MAGAFAPLLLIAALTSVVSADLCSSLNATQCQCFQGIYCLSWQIVGDTSVNFIVEAQTMETGWVGFGISNGKPGLYMYPANVQIMWLLNGQPVITERFTTAHASPPYTPAPATTTVTSGSYTNGVLHFEFTRALSVDSAPYATISDTNQNMIWAYAHDAKGAGLEDALPQHDLSGAAIINFFTGRVVVVPPSSAPITHGVLMFVAYAIFFPIAQIIARYLKGAMGVWWFRAHVALMLLGICLIIAAFGIIVNEIGTGGQHFFGTGILGAHKLFGLIVVIFTFAQPMIGQLANLLWNETREKVPIWPDKVHWWLGRLILLCALVQIGLGIDAYNITLASPPSWPWIVYGIITLAIAVVFLVLECVKGQVHHQPAPTGGIDRGASMPVLKGKYSKLGQHERSV